ncbi:DUF448 domain-containing protein [Campylobacter sp. 2014D-0216]|uniref:DUF448 domain-containing protein n=2 Tax=unclassified Campylobacter TaxID=2593542 RepID=UPI000EA8AE17|nr:DUF448 domain-containing protein [Campylobacter sp. P255]QOR01398.1 DUF448 domain-containing protein [Campylobacter sp. 2014D-0216]RKO64651.1 hypothetical protein CKA54_04410 [Campylobacter sp. P255]
MKNHIPIRMCIVCKGRYEKQSLHRFQIKNSQIITKVEFGRSLYICNPCLDKDEKTLQRAFMRACKGNFHGSINQQDLKEIFFNGRCKN